MIIFDEDLFNTVRSRAGREIHDVYSASGIYRMSITTYNRYLQKGYKEEALADIRFRIDKYERICRSFLITGDIHESRRLVEEAISQGK